MTRTWHDGAADIRRQLISRIDSLDRRAGALRPNQVADELEMVRRIAATNGIGAAITVIHAIDSALARGEQGALVHGWLEILRDAVGSGASDARTCETYAAACRVRLMG